MTNEKLNLQPLRELLTSEVGLDELIEHLDSICYNFAECALKVSCMEKQHVYNDVVVGCYWLERLKQMFKEMRR